MAADAGGVSRREVLVLAGRLAALGMLAGCGSGSGGAGQDTRSAGDGPAHLSARPPGSGVPPGEERFPGPGTHPVGEEGDPEVLLHVPTGLAPGEPVPLVVTLHGAGGDAYGGLGFLRTVADERGLVLLAPTATGRTWDAIRGDFGADVAVVDRALQRTFDLLAVAEDRIAVAGFSDGASYALGLGLANGGLFGRVLAFSPGFAPAARPAGRPRVFVSHGEDDDVLPVESTSRQVVRDLRQDGYDVTYREFTGGHAVPAPVAREAVGWLGWSGLP